MARFCDMPKDWMDLPRHRKQYVDGVISFLEFAYTVGEPVGRQIQCPCKKCRNINWLRRDVVFDHLVVDGFVKGYRTWINHEELPIEMEVDDEEDDEVGVRDDMEGLLNDVFGEGGTVGPNEEAEKFYGLMERASQELYPGCKNFSTLSFVVRLYLLKCLHGWSNACTVGVMPPSLLSLNSTKGGGT